jgi:hypothetical protein
MVMVNCSESMALCKEGTTRLKLGPIMTPDGVSYLTRLDGPCSRRGDANTSRNVEILHKRSENNYEDILTKKVSNESTQTRNTNEIRDGSRSMRCQRNREDAETNKGPASRLER